MSALHRFLGPVIMLVLGLGLFHGCESTDGGSGGGNVSVYYGVGFYDPWYYGAGYYPPDVIVTPPDRPDRPDRPHVEQPIARPTSGAAATSRAAPSIPSTPRAMPRAGGRR